MRATQTEIARACGLDVSSVNKILNETPGPSFMPETKRKVFQVARKLGYERRYPTRHWYAARVRLLEQAIAGLVKHALHDGSCATCELAARIVLKPQEEKKAVLG